MDSDWAETWLNLKKKMQTWQAAATLNQWSTCEEIAGEMRVLATDLFLFAKQKSETRGDRG